MFHYRPFVRMIHHPARSPLRLYPFWGALPTWKRKLNFIVDINIDPINIYDEIQNYCKCCLSAANGFDDKAK